MRHSARREAAEPLKSDGKGRGFVQGFAENFRHARDPVLREFSKEAERQMKLVRPHPAYIRVARPRRGLQRSKMTADFLAQFFRQVHGDK